METYQQDKTAIADALHRYYFDGIYEGNLDLLNQVFQKDTWVFGDIKGQSYAKTLEQYLDGVAHRTSPKESGKPYETEIISIDVINSIAVAKVRVKMYAFNYYDFLSFHKIDNRWVIVNKMLTDVTE